MPSPGKHTPSAQQSSPPETQAEASPWAGLRSRFLESLDTAEQLRIFDLSTQTSPKLDRWAARYPPIRRIRVEPLSLSVAAAASFCDADALVATASLSLWVFALDDVFDEEQLSRADLTLRAERYKAIAHYRESPPPGDSLAAALADVRDVLARYPLFESLGARWADALGGTIDGMIREDHWRLGYRRDRTASLPSYEEYVETGLYSVGGPPYVWAAIITSDDPSTPEHVDHLRTMERITSTCIRLANDLQTYWKEVGEGKINALVILEQGLQKAGLSAEEAHRQAEGRVRADIAGGLNRLEELQSRASTQTGRPEAATADIARFVCDFYTHHDYHTFAAQGS